MLYFLRVKIFFIVILCLVFGFFRFNERLTFDWDQADDATKIMGMIEQKKPLLIGPRVANDSGFFVGPIHYYFLTPFYLLTKGDPMAGGITAILVSILTSIAGFWVAKKIYGQKAGIITGLLLASTTGIMSWNVMYTVLFGIIGYFLCLKILESKTKYFPLLMLVYGLAATSHLVPASMGLSVLVAIILSKKKPELKQIFLGLGLFLIAFVPNLIFDLRHDFINLKKIFEFILGNKTSNSYSWWLFLRSFWRSLNLNTFGWNIYTQQTLIIISNLLIISIIIFEIFKFKTKQKILTLVWVATPLLVLGFYKGGIPEYYYGLALSVLMIILGKFMSRFDWKIAGLMVILFIGVRFYEITKIRPVINMEDKKKVVKYIVDQKDDPIFNVSYDLGTGMDTGYQYLFKYYGKEPTNSEQGHLYTIVLMPSGEDEKVVFKSNRVGVIRR